MTSQVSKSHHAILAVEDTPKMTITDGSVTLTSTAGNHATDVIGSDVFILSGTTANVTLADISHHQLHGRVIDQRDQQRRGRRHCDGRAPIRSPRKRVHWT